MGQGDLDGIDIQNARIGQHNADYARFLYSRQERNGLLFRDCQRLVNQDRNVFGACMVAHGHADAMVTGLTRRYNTVIKDIRLVIDPLPGKRMFGVTIIIAKGRTVFIADTTVHELPDAEMCADIAVQTAEVHAPRASRPGSPSSPSRPSATRASARRPGSGTRSGARRPEDRFRV
jgi:malate dehydrogenase (oxaloacetate-decarboxylating)(NADP+)